jgi:excisionase family DNA binding protein
MERLLTTDEVAEYLRVDVVTIRRLISRGELTAYRIGGEYRFTQSDLEDYLQRQRVSAGTGDGSGTFASTPREGVRKGLQGKHTTPFDPVSDRFDKFTGQARRVLHLSQEEAQRFQHHYVGTEHLLLGLLREDAGVAAQVLRNLNVEPKQVREAVESIIGRGGRIVLGEIGLTPRARKVIELSVDEARRLDQHYVGTEHLLLGLIREGEGIAAEVLESQGVKLDQARAETLRALRQLQESETDTVPPLPSEAATLLAEGEPGLTCAHCGARCPNYFRHCFNCGQPLKPQ